MSQPPGGIARHPAGHRELELLAVRRGQRVLVRVEVQAPANASIVTSSGEVTNACVFGLPSLRFAKRLYDG